MKNPVGKKHKGGNTMMRNALELCARMSAAAVEFRLIVRLPVLISEFGEAYKALREPEEVRVLLDVDSELLSHAFMQLPRIVVAAVDECAKTFVGELDRDGWVQVLLVALEADNLAGSSNVVCLDTRRSARASYSSD